MCIIIITIIIIISTVRYWAQHTLAWRRILKCDWFIAGSAVVVDLVIYVDPVRCVVSTLPFHALHFPYCFVLALFGRSMHVAIPDRDCMHVALPDRDCMHVAIPDRDCMHVAIPDRDSMHVAIPDRYSIHVAILDVDCMHVAIPDRDSMHVAILDRDKVVTTTTATTTVTVVTSFLSVVVVTIFVLCSGHFFPPCSGGHDLCPLQWSLLSTL